jgi:hypothetical protein
MALYMASSSKREVLAVKAALGNRPVRPHAQQFLRMIGWSCAVRCVDLHETKGRIG